MAFNIRYLLLCILSFTGCSEKQTNVRVVFREPVGTDTIIIKHARGNYLSGGTIIQKINRDNVISNLKTFNDYYDEAKVLGFNSIQRDSIILNLTVVDTLNLNNKSEVLRRTDTITLKWK